MFASRSELKRLFLLLLAAVLFAAAPDARGAMKTPSKAKADTVRATSEDEGISVRVVDGAVSKALKKSRVKYRIDATEVPDTLDKPDKPEPPEPPEPPDHDNDLVRFGQDITIEQGQVVNGSVIAIGGNINVKGEVRGDCTAVGGSVSVEDSAVVGGDAVSVGGETSVSDGGKVMGSNVSVGLPSRGGHVHGMLPFLGLVGLGALAGVVSTAVQLLITLLLAWLAVLLIRERLAYAVDRMGTHFGKSILWGLVAWTAMIVALPAIVIVGCIAMVILVITIIGIPVAILLLIAMVFALIGAVLGIVILTFLAYVNGAMYLGRLILHRWKPGATVSPMKAVILGAVLILGLKVLSNVLGFLGVVFVMPIGIALGIASAVLCVVLTTAGMGAMVMTRLAKGPGLAGAAPGAPPPPAAPEPGAGWYAPPPTPPTAPPPPHQHVAPPPPRPPDGTSDAP